MIDTLLNGVQATCVFSLESEGREKFSSRQSYGSGAKKM